MAVFIKTTDGTKILHSGGWHEERRFVRMAADLIEAIGGYWTKKDDEVLSVHLGMFWGDIWIQDTDTGKRGELPL